MTWEHETAGQTRGTSGSQRVRSLPEMELFASQNTMPPIVTGLMKRLDHCAMLSDATDGLVRDVEITGDLAVPVSGVKTWITARR